MVTSNKFFGFFLGFLLMASGLSTKGPKGKTLIYCGAAAALILFFLPGIKKKWKTAQMLRRKYGFKTYKEFEEELKKL